MIFVAATLVGYAGLVWIALAPGLAAWAHRPLLRTTFVTAATVWSADLIATILKAVFDRPRPFEALDGVDPLVTASLGTSMPSGHAATSFAGAVVLAALVGRAVPALFGLAALIALSRVYVGAHYPLDILAGAALGTAVGLAAAAVLRALPRPVGAPPRSGGSTPPG